MQVIPVIDLLNGQAVHAVGGRRHEYLPVQSVLCNTSDPLDLAGAFRDQLNLNNLYVADLNAIQDLDPAHHRSLIHALCRLERIHIILDAGASEYDKVQALIDSGVHKVIVGSETLTTLDSLRSLPNRIDPKQLVFSLDMKDGKILSRAPELVALTPPEVIEELKENGWQEALLLDLTRVGSSDGINLSLVTELRRLFQDFPLFIGGGIASAKDLVELYSLGVSGALVATALHNGTISAPDIAHLAGKRRAGLS